MTDFQIQENMMLKPFATLTSCRDTIDSECPRGLTLDKCVDRCRQSPFCSCGYYIEPKYGSSYCVPMNSILIKNMNLHLNTYDVSKDPTKELWKRTAVFFRPDIYPLGENNTTIIMQKDICLIYYVFRGKYYYLQKDLRWVLDKDGEDAIRVLFIDKYPQFYELANNIQSRSEFILKVFEKPEVITIVQDQLKIIPYLTLSGENVSTDMFLYIPPDMSVVHNPLLREYPVLSFSTPFQVLTHGRSDFMGVREEPKGGVITIAPIPYTSDKAFTGHFMVIRKDIQPNIYKVADILDARLTFLKDSVSPPERMASLPMILLSVAVALIVTCLCLLLLVRNRRLK